MGARADFDHRHHACQLPLQLDVPLQDDGIGQKRRPVRTEPEIDITILQFSRHQHRDAHASQDCHQAVERLAEIIAERGGKRQLEA